MTMKNYAVYFINMESVTPRVRFGLDSTTGKRIIGTKEYCEKKAEKLKENLPDFFEIWVDEVIV